MLFVWFFFSSITHFWVGTALQLINNDILNFWVNCSFKFVLISLFDDLGVDTKYHKSWAQTRKNKQKNPINLNVTRCYAFKWQTDWGIPNITIIVKSSLTLLQNPWSIESVEKLNSIVNQSGDLSIGGTTLNL